LRGRRVGDTGRRKRKRSHRGIKSRIGVRGCRRVGVRMVHTLELPGQKHANGGKHRTEVTEGLRGVRACRRVGVRMVCTRSSFRARKHAKGGKLSPIRSTPTRLTPTRRPVSPPGGFKILSPVRKFRGSLVPSLAQNFPLPT
jgi:hypothetical protein